MILDTMGLVTNALGVVMGLVFDKTKAVIYALMFVVMLVQHFHMEAAQFVSLTHHLAMDFVFVMQTMYGTTFLKSALIVTLLQM